MMAELERIEKIADIAMLFDCYGPLLTAKQQEALRLCYEEDFSLGEIAALSGASRQAAHDLIKRGEALLLQYERTLHLLARYREQQRLYEALQAAAAALPASPGKQTIVQLLAELNLALEESISEEE